MNEETKKTPWQTVAHEAAGAFETFRRDGSDLTQYRFRADCPEWGENGCSQRIHAALDDRLPSDWVYRTMAHVADALTQHDDADSAREAVGEIADNLVDVYTSERLQWLADHTSNARLVDEAVADFGHSDQGIVGDIAAGQYMAIERIASAMINEIEAEIARREVAR